MNHLQLSTSNIVSVASLGNKASPFLNLTLHFRTLASGGNSVHKPTWSSNDTSRALAMRYAANRFAHTTNLNSSNKQVRHQQQQNLNLSIKQSVVGDSDHLPALPVPDFHKTINRLKDSILPFAMNSAELAEALGLIDSFTRHGGPKLDLLLRKKADSTSNWLTHDWWVDEVYLKARQPLVIHSNPAFVYPQFPFDVDNQRKLITTTAHLISSLVDFKLSLLSGYNPEAITVDGRIDNSICFHQYNNLFGTIRVPGEEIDSLVLNSLANCKENDPIRIVVSLKGKFYELSINDHHDKSARVDTITSMLTKIISELDNESGDERLTGLGVLTTQCRTKWAKTYRLLDEDSIEALREAEFVVSIENISETTDESERSKNDLLRKNPTENDRDFMAALGRQVLHSDSENVGNRWFDKTLQLIIVSDERIERLLGVGLNFEHCVVEGQVIGRLIEYSYDKTVQDVQSASSNSSFSPNLVNNFSSQSVFRQLPMYNADHTDQLKIELKNANADASALISQLELSYFSLPYGSNAIKSWRFSPDSWFQVGLSAAYYNLHKRVGACYETAATRQFKYGRTETIRSMTSEVAEYCARPSLQSLQRAIVSHKKYVLAAKQGEGIDRALLGYKLAFNELRSRKWAWGLPRELIFKSKSRQQSRALSDENVDINVNEIFTDKELRKISAFFSNELIKRSSKFCLSTSQVSSFYPNIYMTYGPLTLDGYGCSYNITGQQIAAAITANSHYLSFDCDVEGLNQSLLHSFNDMRNLVEGKKDSL